MKVGVIGAGRMAQRRIANLPQGCELAAVYAPEGIGTRYAGPDITAYLTTMEEALSADLVIVATPHAYLQHYGRDALSPYLLIEKPGGIPGQQLIHACYGYNHRFWPGILTAKKAITAPILHIRGVYGHGNADREWRMNSTLSGGGEMLDQGSHLIDLTRYFTGSEVTLGPCRLRTEVWDCKVEDTAMFVLHADETIAQHSVSWCEWSPVFSFDIITEAEKITINGFPWTGQTVHITTRTGNHRAERFYGDRSLRLELQDMLDGGTTGATAADAQAVLSIVEEAYS